MVLWDHRSNTKVTNFCDPQKTKIILKMSRSDDDLSDNNDDDITEVKNDAGKCLLLICE